ncbi:hypothetical protein TTHT_1628 [Thermotomaculum hydrothermale]|uniref:Calcineurin-like phosphoesterase domain-containing protein n=1 Tax=Thermotomaculum hydrothermale TaxID=981385 RepID=A0A7R6PRQ5_9BACT|nr:metallophosphoesterase [Thermotomaculum hydrothermale]BBB33116.1 hypothetical protein TTHT_1628 [Thermotomaculum hydrothermale]
MKKSIVFIFVLLFPLLLFSEEEVSLIPHRNLIVKSVKVESVNKGLKFNIKSTKKVKFASVIIGFLPDENAFYPVYRFSKNEFVNGKDFEILINWKKFKWYLNKDKTLVFYKINLIDKKGKEEQYRSRVLISRNHKILQTVIYGPYFDRGEDNSYTVSFELLYPDKATLVFNGKKYFSSEKKKRHFIKLGKLKKGNYKYYIEGYPRVFNARVNETDNFSFVFMSDSRNRKTDFDANFENTNGKIVNKIFLTAFNKGADFIVFVGDMVSGYTFYEDEFERELKSFAYATEPISSIIPVYEGMGNHEALMDCFEKNGEKFCKDKKPPHSAEDVFGRVFVNPENADFSEKKGLPSYKENLYYFEYGNCLFVVLNTNYWWGYNPEKFGGNLEGYIMDNQLKWLEKVLDKEGKGKREIFVFAHEPAFPCSAHLKDGMYYWGGDPAKNGGIDRHYVIKRRNEFLKVLDKYGVKIVFFGDEHNYTRVLINKDIAPVNREITQIISGGAGAPFYELADNFPWKKNLKAFSKENHFILVKVGEKVRVEAVSIHGYVVDSFEIK